MAHARVTYLQTACPGGANMQNFFYALTFYGDDVSAEIATGQQIEFTVTVSNSFAISELKDRIIEAVQAKATLLGLTIADTDIFAFEPTRVALWDYSGLAFVQDLVPYAWYRYGLGITSAATLVSQWDDQSGNLFHHKQATGVNQPVLEADGSLLFDGTAKVLKTDALLTISDPMTLYLLMKQNTWTASDTIVASNGNDMNLAQSTAITPQLQLFAGTSVAANSNLPLNTYGVVCAVFNGASSLLQINKTAPATGNPGATSGTTIALGATTVPGNFFHGNIKEKILFRAAHDAATRVGVIDYLAEVGGISV